MVREPQRSLKLAIVGHGIDLVSVARVRSLLSDVNGDFADATFTPQEIGLAQAKKRSGEFLAGRFAAKEAVLKALGTGFSGDIAFTEVEIGSLENGQPIVALSGEAARVAASLSVCHWLLSISHTHDHAVASAIALSRD